MTLKNNTWIKKEYLCQYSKIQYPPAGHNLRAVNIKGCNSKYFKCRVIAGCFLIILKTLGPEEIA